SGSETPLINAAIKLCMVAKSSHSVSIANCEFVAWRIDQPCTEE
ncbi:MAG: hypothetical protein ACI8TX_002320, partial [Hyphomicrobiaceae bacterium]